MAKPVLQDASARLLLSVAGGGIIAGVLAVVLFYLAHPFQEAWRPCYAALVMAGSSVAIITVSLRLAMGQFPRPAIYALAGFLYFCVAMLTFVTAVSSVSHVNLLRFFDQANRSAALSRPMMAPDGGDGAQ